MKNTWRLLLFLATTGCSTQSGDITTVWDNDRAVGVRMGHALFPVPVTLDSIRIHIAEEGDPVLGETVDESDGILFTPHVPFTGGLTYDVRYGSRKIRAFEIPLDTTLSDPELLAVYPSSDTVPENLLKVYLAFSEPMMEGSSLSHIYLIRNNQDTLRDVFLDLQPELWNADATVLTLWLDPGRVKRDLIPNKTLGKPIDQQYSYKLVVERHWRSKQGAHTRRDHTKSFFVTGRDEVVPKPGKWRVKPPLSSTRDTLFILFDEPLDSRLMTDAIHVLDPQRRLVECEKVPGPDDRSLCLIPVRNWDIGSYAVMIEPRLEDLAGNNLTRKFDRDLLAEPAEPGDGEAVEIMFTIP